MREKSAQAALQFLTTYAWAFLVIVVVLIALFYFGVFNLGANAKAQPGSCQVVRPYGPFTSQFLSLTGVCNGELPEFAVEFFSDRNYFYIEPTPVVTGYNVTMTGWVYITGLSQSPDLPRQNVLVIEGGGDPSEGAGARLSVNDQDSNEVDFAVWTGTGTGDYVEAQSKKNTINLDQWYFVAGTYNGSFADAYINGTLAGSAAQNGIITVCDTSGCHGVIGATGVPDGGYLHGYISNVQLYNRSLSSSEIKELYLEGIGGAPIYLQALVGWWPLNGNGDDYGGNGLNGGPTNVSYTEQWQYTGYMPPSG